jgi:hypothetical protein
MNIVKPSGTLANPMSVIACGCCCSVDSEILHDFQSAWGGGCGCQCSCHGSSTVDNTNDNTSLGFSHKY